MNELALTMWLIGAVSGALLVGSAWMWVDTIKVRDSLKEAIQNEKLG